MTCFAALISVSGSCSPRPNALKHARIFAEILVRAKLTWIDEDRNCHDIRLRLGRAHQREMALMQRAHRGDKTETPPTILFSAAGRARFLHGFVDLHRNCSPRRRRDTEGVSLEFLRGSRSLW